ncbi:hypothetical protein [Hymenobacter nivis]|uniref:hypothetical protein n=1 Tax=Hymenobacter nivis TaxID=1850093 RepID=UPI0011275AF9|nr:hypothetical protein [Hymenobacter nivis]
MDEDIWHQSIFNRKLIVKRDWFADVFGLIPYVLPLLISGLFLFSKNGSIVSFAFFFLFSCTVFQGIYSLHQENNLSEIQTEYSAAHNKQALLFAIDHLNWSLLMNEDTTVTAVIDNRLGFINQNLIALITDQAIYFNIKHEGTSKGRVPFFFGLNEKRGIQLVQAIEQYNFDQNNGLLQRP